MTGRTTRDPSHVCPPEHKHGVYCYRNHRCGCADCRAVIRETQERRRKLIAYGRYESSLIDATPARAHVEALRAVGIGVVRIAVLTGLSEICIRDLVSHSHGQMTRRSAALILAVPLDAPVAGGVVVDPTPTRRRLQALVARGWPQAAITRELGGAASSTVYRLLSREVPTTAAFAARVAALYDRLWDQPPVAVPQQISRARNYAAARGWVPPLAWDDIDTDPKPPRSGRMRPSKAYDEIAVELTVAGYRPRPLSPLEREEAIRRCHAHRYSDGLIAAYVGVDSHTVDRTRKRLGLAAWDKEESEHNTIERSAA